ncbi:hypothetical protein A311_04480, partial [Escherichia coli KTE146]
PVIAGILPVIAGILASLIVNWLNKRK